MKRESLLGQVSWVVAGSSFVLSLFLFHRYFLATMVLLITVFVFVVAYFRVQQKRSYSRWEVRSERHKYPVALYEEEWERQGTRKENLTTEQHKSGVMSSNAQSTSSSFEAIHSQRQPRKNCGTFRAPAMEVGKSTNKIKEIEPAHETDERTKRDDGVVDKNKLKAQSILKDLGFPPPVDSMLSNSFETSLGIQHKNSSSARESQTRAPLYGSVIEGILERANRQGKVEEESNPVQASSKSTTMPSTTEKVALPSPKDRSRQASPLDLTHSDTSKSLKRRSDETETLSGVWSPRPPNKRPSTRLGSITLRPVRNETRKRNLAISYASDLPIINPFSSQYNASSEIPRSAGASNVAVSAYNRSLPIHKRPRWRSYISDIPSLATSTNDLKRQAIRDNNEKESKIQRLFKEFDHSGKKVRFDDSKSKTASTINVVASTALGNSSSVCDVQTFTKAAPTPSLMANGVPTSGLAFSFDKSTSACNGLENTNSGTFNEKTTTSTLGGADSGVGTGFVFQGSKESDASFPFKGVTEASDSSSQAIPNAPSSASSFQFGAVATTPLKAISVPTTTTPVAGAVAAAAATVQSPAPPVSFQFGAASSSTSSTGTLAPTSTPTPMSSTSSTSSAASTFLFGKPASTAVGAAAAPPTFEFGATSHGGSLTSVSTPGNFAVGAASAAGSTRKKGGIRRRSNR